MVAGQLSDRFGPRWVLTATGLTTGIGYFMMSSMTAPWQLLLCYGLLVGLGFATHDVVTLSTVANWFPRRRGLVTGIVKAGSGCGQILVPVLVTWLLTTGGWRNAFAVLGVLAGVLLTVLAQLMQRQAEPASENVDALNSSEEDGLEIIGVNFKHARSDRTLWKFCAIEFCFIPSLMTVPLHIVAHATDLGLSAELAALILSTVGAASIVGRLIMGHWVDRFGARQILCSCLAALWASLLMLCFIDVPLWLFPTALIYGVAHGGLFMAVSPSVAEYFGMKSHGAIFGMVLFFGTLSGTAGPVIAGILFDRFQSYDFAFTILALLSGAGVLLALSLPSKSQSPAPL